MAKIRLTKINVTIEILVPMPRLLVRGSLAGMLFLSVAKRVIDCVAAAKRVDVLSLRQGLAGLKRQ